MSGVIHKGIGLEAALTSEHEVTRILARLAATAAGEEILAWYRAERERGTNVLMLLFVLADFTINIHASFAGQALEPSGLEKVIGLLKDRIDAHYAPCFGEAVAHRAAMIDAARSAKPQGQAAVADVSASSPERDERVRTEQ